MAAYLGGDREADIDRRIFDVYARLAQQDLIGDASAARPLIDAEPWE